MKKKGEIDIRKSAIKKVAKSGSQEIEKRVTKKRERGITLIALVVTIIIMLILAVVTLNMALGDNGLIQMAKFATNKYEQAAINESLAMNELSKGLGGGSGSNPTTPTGTPEGGGGVETPEGTKTASDLTENNYGDYVNYGLDLNGDNNFTNDWRIFYVGNESNGEANGRIFLIAADYVKSSCNILKLATASAGMSEVSTTISGYCYHWAADSIPTYHCNDGHNLELNPTKTQCSFPEFFMPDGDFCTEGHYYCSDYVGDGGSGGDINSLCSSALQCTGNWEPFVKNASESSYADYATGGPTLELWVASWNAKYGNEMKLQVSANRGYGGYTMGSTYEDHVKGTSGETDTLYFPRQSKEIVSGSDEDSTDTCYGYWLASPSYNSRSQLMYVEYNGYVTYSDVKGKDGMAIRPVICLKSGVSLKQSRKLWRKSRL